MVTIRKFEHSDADAVAVLIATTMRISNSRDYSSSTLEALIAYFTPSKLRALAAERTCLVAEVDGRVVGTGALDADELATFFVHPDFQHRGVGSQLLLALEHAASAAGHQQLRVESSLTGAGFYARYGYERCGPPVERSAGMQIPMLKHLVHS